MVLLYPIITTLGSMSALSTPRVVSISLSSINSVSGCLSTKSRAISLYLLIYLICPAVFFTKCKNADEFSGSPNEYRCKPFASSISRSWVFKEQIRSLISSVIKRLVSSLPVLTTTLIERAKKLPNNPLSVALKLSSFMRTMAILLMYAKSSSSASFLSSSIIQTLAPFVESRISLFLIFLPTTT